MRYRYVRFTIVGLLALVLLGAASLALAQGDRPDEMQAPDAALGTAFTYQGRLLTGATPVSGTCDFTFTLYDAASGGASLGLENKPGVAVNDGYFTVQLDFGAAAFEGDARYLEIEVDCGAGSTTLTPRQELTAAPYALHARLAGSAGALQGQPVAGAMPTVGQALLWNGSAWTPDDLPGGNGATGDITAVYSGTGLLGGGESGDVTLRVDFAGSGSANTVARSDHDHAGAYAPTTHDHDTRYYTQTALQNGAASVHWNALTNVPGGLADGDDDTTYTVTAGLTLTGTQLGVDFGGNGATNTVARSDHDHDEAYQPLYKRTVIVSPAGDGSDQEANGAALLDALDTITDATSTNPYLLKIEPGIYDVVTTPVTMKSYVDIEGSGVLATEIKSAGFYTFTKATVLGADEAELRSLTVTSDGGYQDPVAMGIYADRRIDFQMRNIEVQAWDALSYTYGIYIKLGGATFEEVGVEASVDSGGVSCFGIANEGGRVTMDDVSVASYDGFVNVGIGHTDASTPPEMTDIDVTVSRGSSAQGIRSTDASPQMTNVRVEVSLAEYGYAIYNGGASSAPVLNNVVAASTGSGTWDYGLYNADGSATVTIDRSTLSGDTYSIRNGPQAATTLNIGASQLDGPINNDGGGTFTCVASYDGAYAALGTNCQ